MYAAGNATFEFLHLSYTADEMGIPFPQPFTMQIDNKAAIAFSDNSAFKSKLKHIDVRQKWVQTLRNKSIINTVHVPSEETTLTCLQRSWELNYLQSLETKSCSKDQAFEPANKIYRLRNIIRGQAI